MRTDVALLVRDIAKAGGLITVADADRDFDWGTAYAASRCGLLTINQKGGWNEDADLVLTNEGRGIHGLPPIPPSLLAKFFCKMGKVMRASH